MLVTKRDKIVIQIFVFKITSNVVNSTDSLTFEVETPVRTSQNTWQHIIDTSSFEPYTELRFQVSFL